MTSAQALQGMLAPKLVEQVEGHAEVRMVIKAGRAGNVAGSYVTDGRIVRGGQVRVFRGSEPGGGQADHVAEALQGRRSRGGDRLRVRHRADIDEIAEGDVIECYQMVAESAWPRR